MAGAGLKYEHSLGSEKIMVRVWVKPMIVSIRVRVRPKLDARAGNTYLQT